MGIQASNQISLTNISDTYEQITKVEQNAKDYTISAITELNIGTTNILNGSMLYTENNKLSLTATTDDFVKTLDNIYFDLE